MKTPIQKDFVSTAEGQRSLCYAAGSRAVVSMLNTKVRSLGGAAWDDAMIATATQSTLNAIREDLLPIYNALVAKPSA